MSKARFEGSWTHEKVGSGDGDTQSIELATDENAVILSAGPWSLWLDATTAAALSNPPTGERDV